MFGFAYANMNNSFAAAANCAEAASSCAANTCASNAVNMLKMDAALAASICICGIGFIGLISLRVLAISLLGLIIIRQGAVLGLKTQA